MTKRSDIVGLTRLKNKVKKNAFDLSHRHMFTAEIGELLPVFVQWVNPNETFKIGYNGMTRTTPLQTAAFTRLRENIQYYFVPFQSLWKYFEGNINNMTTGQSGENISKIAASAVSDSALGTGMPYININGVRSILAKVIYETALCIVTSRLAFDYDTIMSYLRGEYATGEDYRDIVFMPNGDYSYLSSRNTLRFQSMAKLLNSLGYGNFVNIMTYDLIDNLIAYGKEKGYSSFADFISSDLGQPTIAAGDNFFFSKYGIIINLSDNVSNIPNVSIFPLLAYHKIINDHYRYLQWQPYRSYLSNIDYIKPTDNMEYSRYLSRVSLSDNDTIFDLKFSNLPLDYFNGVLPRAQYGEESSALVNLDPSTLEVTIAGPTYSSGPSTAYATDGHAPSGNLSVGDNLSITAGNSPVAIRTPHTHAANFNAGDAAGTLKISALRSALALQKYKEIQNSNDPDFATQVLAHFGIKPKHDDYASEFIGGGDSTIDINPVINQNLDTDESSADIKATATGTLTAGCKFHSDTYGIIIGIYRCTPQLDFSHIGIDRNLFKTDASDFPLPELDSIGMQTQYRVELAAPPAARVYGDENITHTVDYSTTYGYLPRYAELKTSYDRVDGAFNSAYSSWVTGYTPKMLQLWILNNLSAGSAKDFSGISNFLVCNPDICYNIFMNQRSSSVNDDKLLIGSVNTCVAVRPFSKYGLPYEN